MGVIRLGHRIEGLHGSLTNGPGWRVCLWTQGCSLRCTARCLNPGFLNAEGGWLVPVDSVLDQIRKACGRQPRTEGVTILGGEPFDQALAVDQLLRGVRRLGLTTMVYTGHVYEDFAGAADDVRRLLEAIDVLVDGPYIDSQYSGEIAWRGSTNQRLLCLSTAYTEEALRVAYLAQGKAFSIEMRASGAISAGGIQERTAATRIERRIRAGTHRTS